MRFAVLLSCLVFGSTPLTLMAGDFTPGHGLNSLGRWIGYGWSRGYHAQDGCRSATCTPANPIEPMPTMQPVNSAPLKPAQLLPSLGSAQGEAANPSVFKPVNVLPASPTQSLTVSQRVNPSSNYNLPSRRITPYPLPTLNR